MPNHDACIICSGVMPVQAAVLIANSDVHFLNDGASHYNIGGK